ncbi:MAG: ParB/RepB/Spo0J family partition protein [Elusimicrobia bacterium]|nr:ParB/RepB/Spo0J family partition protein [Elusimicrobiota bacterium]
MRQALGKGLDALITGTGASDNPYVSDKNLVKIPINKIRPNHLQPRKTFNDSSIAELAQSIREHGLAQPIIVSKDSAGDTYELIAGERRWRAAQVAGLSEIEAVIRSEIDNKKRLALALIENLQREDLNAIDAAVAYLRLMKEYSLTLGQLSEYTGKSKPSISNTIRLLDLEPEIQNEVQNGRLSEGHARALLMISSQFERKKLFQLALQGNLSVRDLEDEARNVQESSSKISGISTVKQRKSSEVLDMESNLQRLLGTKVDIKLRRSAQRGVLSVHFFSLNDLERIVNILLKK